MKKVVIALLALVLLSSCWDKEEIERIGFVLAVALDPLSEVDLEKYEEEYKKETGQPARQLFKTTYQIVIPNMVVAEAVGHAKEPFFNISTVGRTGIKMSRQIAARRSRQLNFEHLKALIINEDMVKTGELANLIDFYLRDHGMRRDTFVFISKGEAHKVLAHKLMLEIMPAISIMLIQENYPVHHGMSVPKPIGHLESSVLSDQSYIVPRITANEGVDFTVEGAGLFMGGTNELVGWLGVEDIEAYNLVVGESKNRIIEATLNGQLFDYGVDDFATEITYQLKDGQDSFKIKIKTEGYLAENWIKGIDLEKEKTNGLLNAAIEKEMEQLATNIVEKMQNEFHTDIFKLHKILKNKNYRRWKETKDNWDGEEGYFSKANIDIKAEVNIRHYMTDQQLE